ncbi:MAG: S8 family serine peptidase, partial [Deferrisomatales bacterium]|nr:S8 family serine peptidase [Deferrisomatales bacterium]
MGRDIERLQGGVRHQRALGVVGMALAFGWLVASAAVAQPPEHLIRLRSGQFSPPADPRSFMETVLPGVKGNRAHVILQFRELPDAAQKKALAGAGVKLLSYLPDNAWFASVPKGLNSRRPALDTVRYVGAIAPQDKLPPRILEEGLGPWAENSDGTVNLTVRFFGDVALAEARGLAAAHGFQVLREIARTKTLVVTMDPDGLLPLAAEDTVQWISEAPPPKVLHNDGARENANVDLVQAAPYNLTGAGIVVGVWDGGEIDAAHGDFGARVTVVDAVGEGDHATHVAGTIGGDGTLSAGADGTALQWRGMAPGSDLLSYSFNGTDNIADHDHAITNHGLDISNNSWGYDISTALGNCDSYGDYDLDAPDYDDVVRGLFGRQPIVVFSAGNERNDGDCGIAARGGYACLGLPGSAKNVLTVGAIHSNDDTMTTFSSWGPVDDGRIKPDVVAPGCQSDGDGGITSAIPDLFLDIEPSGAPDGFDDYAYPYDFMCGTSMAAPVVSGIVSLLYEQYVAQNAAEPLPSTLKALLANTAQDLGNPGPDYAFGFGKVDAKAAVDALMAGNYDERQFDGPNGVETYVLEVGPGQPKLQLTLAWDDFPGTVNADPSLVNQLDLLLYDPDGNLHRPWVLDPDTPAVAAGTGQDLLNNMEQITVPTPATGTWTAHVVGASVPQFPQTYSLAWTYGETNHTGEITTNTTWTALASPHVVSGNVFVRPGTTLTIEPGATIRFDGNFYLQVEGRLLAQGTGGSPITFTSNDPFPAAGDWAGIRFVNSAQVDPSVVEHCVIEYVTNGITYTNKLTLTPTVLSNLTVRNYMTYGVYVTGINSSLTLEDSTVTQTLPARLNQGTAVFVSQSSVVTLTGNVLENSYIGVEAYNTSATPPTLTITGNRIVDNGHIGIYSHGYNTGDPGPEIVVNGNDIYGNQNYNVVLGPYANARTTTIDLRMNWWGTTDSREIRAQIYDYNDSTDRPIADFTPFLADSIDNGAPVHPGNYEEGWVSTDTAWSAADSPYTVVGHVFVAE